MNILIVGVGGQGTLLASRVLGGLADIKGLDCKLSEVHGMSQRGGSVVTHVKLAEKVYSPIIAEGDADIILSFEELEAIRWQHFLKRDGVIVCNSQQIAPMPVIIGKMQYPEGIIDKMIESGKKVVTVDALKIAEEVGNPKTANVVMLGVLGKRLNIDFEDMKKALLLTVKPKFADINVVALERGYNY